SLFDVRLVYNLSHVSMARRGDLRSIFDGTLAMYCPSNAVVRLPTTILTNGRHRVVLGANKDARHSSKTMIRRTANHLQHPSNLGSSHWHTLSFSSAPTQATRVCFTATCTE